MFEKTKINEKRGREWVINECVISEPTLVAL